MASFEQNQQDQVNMNNSLDQIKRWQSEWNTVASSIGAAELAAEEELQQERLDNLIELQNEKIKKLNQMLDFEEQSIQTLAKLKLTLSANQFAARKKEIQKEFKLYKAAAEELFKSESKRKFSSRRMANKETSATEDLKASPKKTTTKTHSKGSPSTVQTAGEGVGQLRQQLINAAAAQEMTSAGAQAKANVATDQPGSENLPIEAKAPESQQSFKGDGSKLEAAELGETLFNKVFTKFEILSQSKDRPEDIVSALNKVVANGGKDASQESLGLANKLLASFDEAEKAIRKVREANEQDSHDRRLHQLTAEQKLRTDHAQAEYKAKLDFIAAEVKEKDLEVNHNKYLNEELHNLEVGHKITQSKLTQDIINAEAKKKDLALNEDKYLAEEESKLRKAFAEEENRLSEDRLRTRANIEFAQLHENELLEQEKYRVQNEQEKARHQALLANIAARAQAEIDRDAYLRDAATKLNTEHLNKQHALKTAALDNEAKAQDLIANKDQYILEARLAHENAFYAEKNKLEEESIATQEAINWNSAHSKEIMEQELQKKRLGYLKEYQGYQLKAGKYAVDQAEFEKDKARKDRDAAKKKAVNEMSAGLSKFGSGEFSMTDVKMAYGEYMATRTAELEADGVSESSAKLAANFELLAASAGNLMDELDANVRKIADMQGFIDTRLQGSRENEKTQFSYGKQLLREAKWIAGVSPYIKQEKLVDNIRALVDKGISFDVKQRAFLMTVQEKIANTFNVADGTLLRLIRIQQQDTTAGRLGMESALNSFLNSMYETSEYLENVAGSVRASLEEMQSLMEGTAAVELEYQVQKWMGSLYSVGMSDAAVQDIARAFGQIASGDISGLNGSGTGNLLIMAANEAGMSIADILQEGLQADETNKLMQAMVNYLAEIAETSSDSRVVQQQLANVYGLKASDLRAATNLASSLKDVAKADMSYGGMMGQLNLMMNTIGLRTSVSEGMTNMWDNIMYSMASTQASDPMLYLLPKMANLLKDTTGGIALPFVNVMGFGVDLNTTVADLMTVASLAGTALGTIGPALAGLTDLINPLAGSVMLARAGINPFGKVPVLARGSAPVLQNLSGSSISESGYIGNSSGSDIKNATLQDAEDSKKKQLVEAKDEESSDDVVIKSQQAIIDIYNLLEEVAHGSQSLRVRLVTNGGSPIAGTTTGNGTISDYTSGSLTGGGVSTSADNGNWVLSF